MSAFLGPIHHWLFNKIKFENDLVENIINLSEEKSYSLKRRDVDNICGILEAGNLEDIIDEGNIHAWLQKRISVVEKRLAYSVTVLMSEDKSIFEEIKKLAYEAGKLVRVETFSNARDIYSALENILINGMPCDRVNVLSVQEDELVQWEQLIEIHAGYYEEFGGAVANYYDIREQIIRGIISDTDFEFIENNNKFIIRKRS